MSLIQSIIAFWGIQEKNYPAAKTTTNLGLIDQNTWAMIQKRTDESLLYLLDQQPLA